MKLKITIDNRVYEVEVEASEPEPQALSAVTFSPVAGAPVPVAPTAASENVGQSPVAGVVVKVLVSQGASVSQGQPLIVLEAMKMQTEITAARAGVITRVLVAPGDAVQGGQALYELE